MTAFRNNLEKNDRVFHVPSKRQAKVASAPRGRNTAIIFDGTRFLRYVDVMELRLMPDGRTPETVAPIDGEPPAYEADTPAVKTADVEHADPLAALRDELARNKAEMNGMNSRFQALREKNEKLERAITVLTAS